MPVDSRKYGEVNAPFGVFRFSWFKMLRAFTPERQIITMLGTLVESARSAATAAKTTSAALLRPRVLRLMAPRTLSYRIPRFY